VATVSTAGLLGRSTVAPTGYDGLHAAVDDHSRLADVEVLGDERAQTCARFWRRAAPTAGLPCTASRWLGC
jgi:hypothetical protein